MFLAVQPNVELHLGLSILICILTQAQHKSSRRCTQTYKISGSKKKKNCRFIYTHIYTYTGANTGRHAHALKHTKYLVPKIRTVCSSIYIYTHTGTNTNHHAHALKHEKSLAPKIRTVGLSIIIYILTQAQTHVVTQTLSNMRNLWLQK